jgi:hypothetical protein
MSHALGWFENRIDVNIEEREKLRFARSKAISIVQKGRKKSKLELQHIHEAANRPETKINRSNISKKMWSNPVFRAKRKEYSLLPGVHEKRSMIAKEIASRPDVKEKNRQAHLGRNHTIETRKKISNFQIEYNKRPEVIENKSKFMKEMWADTDKREKRIRSIKNTFAANGPKVLSLETRQKISISTKIALAKQECKDKRAATDAKPEVQARRRAAARNVAIDCYTRDGIFVASYVSQSDAQRKTGIAATNISHCCRGKLKHAGGFVWRYLKS